MDKLTPLAHVMSKIQNCIKKFSLAQNVKIVAVSKKQNAEKILSLYNEGLFNEVIECLEKIMLKNY
jgi:uncharacterized pyridoxal phosphate-containing UPF0001 family protein